MEFFRYYSLSFDSMFNYSFFYFFHFLLDEKEIFYLWEKKIKVSFICKKGIYKPHNLFLLYSYYKTETFSLNTLIANIYSVGKLTSLHYNNISYTSSHYLDTNIKKMYSNWISFFNKKYHLNNYNLFSIFNIYMMCYTYLSFNKISYKEVFLNRFLY